jgi:hypothetical protein
LLVPSARGTVDAAHAFEIVVGILLTVVTAITGASLKAILSLMSRLDRLEARLEVVLEGPDEKSGMLGDIAYLRNRVGWVARAAHALRDRFYHIERHIHIDGMPPLELPPE